MDRKHTRGLSSCQDFNEWFSTRRPSQGAFVDLRLHLDTRSGLLEACRLISVGDWYIQPLGLMGFGPEDEFYSKHNAHCTLYVVSSPEPSVSSKPDTPLELGTSLESDASSEFLLSFNRQEYSSFLT